jgi:competence protein ComEC
LLACGLLLGSLAGSRVPAGCVVPLLGFALVTLGLLALRPGPAATVAALFFTAVALGAAGAAVESLRHASAPLRAWVAAHEARGPVEVHGVATLDLPGEPGAPLVLDVVSITSGGREEAVTGRVRIEVGGQAARPVVVQGDRVSVWTELRFPRGFGTPGAFDPVAHAARAGIHAVGYCKSARLVTLNGPHDPASWRSRLGRARGVARRRIQESLLPGQEQALVRAMVLGDRVGIDRDVSEAFRIAGTYHVLALSGAQVALLAGLLGVLLTRARVPRAPRALILGAALCAYAHFVGGDVPVVRATVAAVVLLLGQALELDADAPNLVGGAACLLLVHRPSSALDIGFQLSFAATLGILLFTGSVVRRLPALPFRAEVALAASLAAQVTLLPLLALHFHRLAPAALVLNLIAVPLSGVVLLAGFAVVVAGAVSEVLAGALGSVAWVGAHALLVSGEVVRHAPWLDVRSPGPGAAGLALHYAGLFALARGAGRRGACVLAAGMALAVWGPGPGPGDGRLHLSVLDVGQGDSLVVRSPHGRTWVVDGGGFPESTLDVGEAVVAPFLWSQGLTRLQGIVATHPHPDHVGGLPFLLHEFEVGQLWEGVAPRSDRGHARFEKTVREWGGSRVSVHRGVAATWDGVAVRVLGPRGGSVPWRTRNDDSVVLALTLGDVTLLLPGDIEAAAERALDAMPAAVLKVAHHGSRTSSTPGLLARVSPRIAIVSAGHRSHFGHPHPEVVARLGALGVPVLRTDRDGTITVSTDGHALWVSTHRDPWPVEVR